MKEKTPCPSHANKITALAYNPTKGAQNQYFCGRGLYLDISSTGRKTWRLKYRVGGKATIHTIGEFPAISLKEAEDKRAEVLRFAKEGKRKRLVDKAEAEKNIREQNQLFRNVIEEWRLSDYYPISKSSQKATNRRLKLFIAPALNGLPIALVTPDHVEAILKKCRNRYEPTSEETKRCLIDLNKIFRYALNKKLIADNPCKNFTGRNSKLTKAAPSNHNQPGLIEPKEFGEMFRKVGDYHSEDSPACHEIAVLFIRVLSYIACRPCELFAANWPGVSFDRKELSVYLSKTKKYVVFALSKQALKVFKQIRKEFPSTDNGAIFNPFNRKTARPIIIGREILINLGYQNKQTLHGFRRSFKTMGEKFLEFRTPAVEEQLTHDLHSGERVRGAYDGQSYLEERKVMMQVWADFIDSLEKGLKPDMQALRERYKEQSAPDFDM